MKEIGKIMLVSILVNAAVVGLAFAVYFLYR